MAEQPPAPSNVEPEIQALTKFHMSVLQELQDMPGAPDMVTAIEILRIVRLCQVYRIDYSSYLEASQGQQKRGMAVLVVDQDVETVEREIKQIRVRKVRGMADDPEGILIPDMDLTTAELLIGELTNAATERLERITDRRGR